MLRLRYISLPSSTVFWLVPVCELGNFCTAHVSSQSGYSRINLTNASIGDIPKFYRTESYYHSHTSLAKQQWTRSCTFSSFLFDEKNNELAALCFSTHSTCASYNFSTLLQLKVFILIDWSQAKYLMGNNWTLERTRTGNHTIEWNNTSLSSSGKVSMSRASWLRG